MRKYEFQTNVLEDLIKKSEENKEEDDIEFIKDIVTSFQTYANTVLTFEDKIKAYKKEHEGDAYRSYAVNLDKTRSNQHNVCIDNINILNRFANMNDLPPFCDLKGIESAKDVNRTDLGDEILNWTNDVFKTASKENIKKFGLDESKREQAYGLDLNKYTKDIETTVKEPTLAEKFNSLAPNNPYPLINQDNHYDFRHIFTMKVVPTETVKEKLTEIIKNQHLSEKEEKIKKEILKDAIQLVKGESKHISKTQELER